VVDKSHTTMPLRWYVPFACPRPLAKRPNSALLQHIHTNFEYSHRKKCPAVSQERCWLLFSDKTGAYAMGKSTTASFLTCMLLNRLMWTIRITGMRQISSFFSASRCLLHLRQYLHRARVAVGQLIAKTEPNTSIKHTTGLHQSQLLWR
jgi:hypothetical protein